MTMLCAVGATAAITIDTKDAITAYTSGTVTLKVTYVGDFNNYNFSYENDNNYLSCQITDQGYWPDRYQVLTIQGLQAGTTTLTAKATNNSNPQDVVTKQVTVTIVQGAPPAPTITKEEDGTVVIYFPQAGLWDYISVNPAVSGSSIPNAIAELKAATNVKVTGTISSVDINEISYLIGNRYTVLNPQEEAIKPARVLDMGEAQLSEEWVSQSTYCIRNITDLTLPQPCEGHTTVPALAGWVGTSGNGWLHDLVITEGWTGLSNNAFRDCYNLNDVYFPATLETIGEYAFYNCKNLEYVDLKRCTEVEEIQKYAFGLANAPTGDVGMGSKVLNLPPNVKYIREGAFYHHSQKVLWIPKYVEVIESKAFEDYGGNTPMSDVFFTGMTAPRIVAADAFSSNSQQAGNGDADFSKLSDTGEADRDVYTRKENGVFYGYCTVLHYPAGSNNNMEYWDKEDAYEAEATIGGSLVKRTMRPDVGEDGHASGKTQGAPGEYEYIPAGWELYKNAKGQYPGYQRCYLGYPDKTLGYEKVWPTEAHIQGAFEMANAGYLWNGSKMTTEQEAKKGLYRFVIASDDTPSDEIKNYNNDLWYTICLPYDMSVDQIKATFGANVQVCRLSGITRDVPESGDRTIKLSFRRSVMDVNGGGYGTTTAYTPIENEEYGTTDSGIKAYYPYMIKPGGETTNPTKTEGGVFIRTFPDYQQCYKPGAIRSDKITVASRNPQSETINYTYAFVGTHSKAPLMQYSYYLGKSSTTGKHQYFFYSGATATEKSQYKWNPFTALVRPSGGADDKSQFFPAASAPQGARMISLFGDDEEDEPTGIKDVDVDVKNSADGKVFSLNGQYVGTSLDNLPKGIYLVNGKKYMVR